ncbi:MAG: tetratricopeptide repeat protein [candidate division Zixibacteria bacterium]
MSELLTEAEQLYNQGQIERARERFEELVRSNPRNKEALNNLGVLAYEENKLGDAARYFTQALEIDPFYKDAIFNICGLLRENGNLDAAGSLLEIAVNKYPDDTELAELLDESLQANTSVSDIKESLIGDDEKVSESESVKTLRVLQGTYEIANQSHTISKALQSQGMYSKTLCYYPNYLKYKSDYTLDLASYKNTREAKSHLMKFAEQLVPQFDVFHFHFGTTLTLDYSDLPILQKADKKIVTHYWGSDVRLMSKAQEFNSYIKVKGDNEAGIIRNMESMAKYVSHCIVGDEELYQYVKDYFEHVHIIRAAIDLDKYVAPENKKENEKFLIVHAPTDSDIKGSTFIQQAVDDLKEDYDFEYRLIKGMSHEEAKKNYAEADLIVDELHCGSYGLLSIETMAMEKPVITWICDFMKEKYPPELPIISANQETVKDKIKYALDNRDELKEIGQRGRAYVEKYHDMNKIARQLMELYQEI